MRDVLSSSAMNNPRPTKIPGAQADASLANSKASWMPRMPIAIKLALSIALLVVAGMTFLGLSILQNQKVVLTKQVNTMGATVAMQLADSATEMVLADDALGLQMLVNNLVDDNILGAVIISQEGVRLAGAGITSGEYSVSYQRNRALANEQVQSFEWQSETAGQPLISFISKIQFNDLQAGHVVVTFSRNDMMQSLSDSRQMIILTTALTAALAIFIAFIMSKHLSRPIHNLVAASQAIDKGDYHYRLNERRNDEIGELALAFNQMAEGLLRKSQVENVFSRFVSSNVARKIMENLDEVELGGKHVRASVLFADIVGFTSMSERMPPQEITQLLNEYFTYISQISSYYKGYIDKFMGDCAMVVFGVPDQDDEHAFNAIACAVMIRELVKQLNIKRAQQGLDAVHFRIGVNSGNVVAGNLGSAERMQYTVVGDPVNLASRLSSIAGADQIIITDELYRRPHIKPRVIAEAHQTIQVRGKREPVTTWLVEGVAGKYHSNMQEHIQQLFKQSENQ